MKFTVIYYVAVGYRAGQYLAKMKRIRTKNLKAYIEKHQLDAAFVFEGWPRLEGETE